MRVQNKGDIANGVTAALGVSGFVQSINGWVSEFMPLFTVGGIIVGLFLSWWYYSSSLKQKERHYRESQHKEGDKDESV